MQNFFFIVSNGKFLRVDLEKVVCVVGIGDRVQVHTADDIYTPQVKMERIREKLRKERFIWVGESMAVAKEMCQ
ncbi:hypothetical protein LZZ85_27705 [Terrimonas sp. NA20]|uniref:HTH LytTR-type domain-containing protein n=1 Tax=Terrimonas ginsenosidimutans TaxID=2908004 RepID=A0ABS9L0P1_9BACT|nr:hypothetical protein [Terrimonas ginsenosidimutans]MCG2618120.1 hypothetical protein [Terrimonas ginsenosidimutans]